MHLHLLGPALGCVLLVIIKFRTVVFFSLLYPKEGFDSRDLVERCYCLKESSWLERSSYLGRRWREKQFQFWFVGSRWESRYWWLGQVTGLRCWIVESGFRLSVVGYLIGNWLVGLSSGS